MVPLDLAKSLGPKSLKKCPLLRTLSGFLRVRENVSSSGFRPFRPKTLGPFSLRYSANVYYREESVNSYLTMGSDRSDFSIQTETRLRPNSACRFRHVSPLRLPAQSPAVPIWLYLLRSDNQKVGSDYALMGNAELGGEHVMC